MNHLSQEFYATYYFKIVLYTSYDKHSVNNGNSGYSIFEESDTHYMDLQEP